MVWGILAIVVGGIVSLAIVVNAEGKRMMDGAERVINDRFYVGGVEYVDGEE